MSARSRARVSRGTQLGLGFGFWRDIDLGFGVFFSLGIELEFVSVLSENMVPIHTLDLDSDLMVFLINTFWVYFASRHFQSTLTLIDLKLKECIIKVLSN